MSHQLFITHSVVPPLRWRMAFSSAGIMRDLPAKFPPDTTLWLHNLKPAEFAGRLPSWVKIIVLHDEPSDEKGLDALASGASGYVNAHAAPDVLQMVDTVVRNNGLWVGESLLNRVLQNFHAVTAKNESADHPELAKLTDREREVTMKVARGESNKEIASELDLAERTVKAHLSSAFHKLGVRDRLQLAVLLRSNS